MIYDLQIYYLQFTIYDLIIESEAETQAEA